MVKTGCGRTRPSSDRLADLARPPPGDDLPGPGGVCRRSGPGLPVDVPNGRAPSASDLAAVRSAATRTLRTRVSASIVLEATQVFGADQPDVTGTGTFDLAAAEAQVEVHQPSGIETVLFFPTMVFVRQPASSVGAALPPGKVWISTDLVHPETVSTNFPQFVLQVEDLNPALLLGEMAWGATSAAPLGPRTVAGSPAHGYLVTVDLAAATARTSGPAGTALSRALQDEQSASGGGPGTAAPRPRFESGSAPPVRWSSSRRRPRGAGWALPSSACRRTTRR